jgi:predicted Zn-dependent protease
VAAQFSLGAVYVALGRTEEALPLLERVAAAAPDHLQTQMQLAVVYHRLGRTADSARAREAVGRLQSEGEQRFFGGVSEALSRLLGKTSDPGARRRSRSAPGSSHSSTQPSARKPVSVGQR